MLLFFQSKWNLLFEHMLVAQAYPFTPAPKKRGKGNSHPFAIPTRIPLLLGLARTVCSSL